MGWVRVGSVSVGPTTDEAVVGTVKVPAFGGLELMARETSPRRGFRFAYGLVSVVTSLGRELGTEKVWPDEEWGALRLGNALSAQNRTGVLTFRPRAVNLLWVKKGYTWTIEFMADQPEDLPQDRYISPGFTTDADRVLTVIRVGTLGRIGF